VSFIFDALQITSWHCLMYWLSIFQLLSLLLHRATLVVCAVSLVGQWMEEAKSKLNGSLRMYQYHGQGRKRDPQKLATDYDLVVTTYQVGYFGHLRSLAAFASISLSVNDQRLVELSSYIERASSCI
jgi:hypothetical protein